jgi:hypothetical protein
MYISLNSVNQLIFVMGQYRVFFEVGNEFLNIRMNFGLRRAKEITSRNRSFIGSIS